MNDSLLMGVLHGLANIDEQLQPLTRAQPGLVAVLRDRHAADQLHHEVGAAGFGRAGIEHLGNIRMVHHRQGLPLGLEPGDHLLGVHARLDDLQRDAAADRLGLLGDIDDAHSPFADLLQQLVAADEGAGDVRGAGRCVGLPAEMSSSPRSRKLSSP